MTTTVIEVQDKIDGALSEYERLCRDLTDARMEEQRLEDERHVTKMRVIRRIMQATNELTGKAHSASSAESVVNIDEEYADYLRRQREIVAAKNILHGRCEAARIRALALANMSALLADAA